MTEPTISISVSIAGKRMDLSVSGAIAVLAALEVGADGFGMVDSDDVEAAEKEAWAFIELFQGAVAGIQNQPRQWTRENAGPGELERSGYSDPAVD